MIRFLSALGLLILILFVDQVRWRRAMAAMRKQAAERLTQT